MCSIINGVVLIRTNTVIAAVLISLYRSIKGGNTMGFVGVVGILLLVLGGIAFFKEPKVTGYYKVLGIYGRFYAYWAVDCVVMPLIIIPMAISGIFEESTALNVIMSIVFLALGVFLYIRVYNKTPDFMKKRCLMDLTITGLATILRVSLFFLRLFFKTWWVVSGPRTYTETSTGETVYVYPDGRVYNPRTNKFGTANDDFTTVTYDR